VKRFLPVHDDSLPPLTKGGIGISRPERPGNIPLLLQVFYRAGGLAESNLRWQIRALPTTEQTRAARIRGDLRTPSNGAGLALLVGCVVAASVKSLSPSQSRPIPRRGLSRTEAAMYVGISPSKFDELVDDNRMPKPRLIDCRKVWDVHELDLAFDELPRENSPPIAGNSWDDR
jgi:predicted DNA-binding transcriptional regulator AlpA